MKLIVLFMIFATFAAQAETRISVTGTEAELCNVDGIKVLHSGNGYSVESFAARNTTPSIVVSLNGKECYFDLVEGEGAGFNVKYNGVTYHTQRPRYVPKFFFTPETSGTEYEFTISAAGTYDIDWGDGTIQTIEKTTTTAQTIIHTFPSAANGFEIKLGGRATAYNTSRDHAAIIFKDSKAHLSAMHGCVGCIFSTLDNDKLTAEQRQPCFYQLFSGNTNLTGTIPEELFEGLYGQPRSSMFEHVFLGCSGLTGSIPEKLFASVQGAPSTSLFGNTFRNCKNLTGPIPEKLFATIRGEPVIHAFHTTFYGCSGLTGEIPEKLFDGLDTSVAAPTNLFYQTFYNCTGLTGPSARIGGRYLYEIWPEMEVTESSGILNTYTNDSKLSDYKCIPTFWGGAGTKNPGECEE